MPVNDRYPLDAVLAECRRYVALRRRKVFVEYVMLAGVNDTPAAARTLAAVLDARSFKVNLIPYNPTGLDNKGSSYEGSSRGRNASRASSSAPVFPRQSDSRAGGISKPPAGS